MKKFNKGDRVKCIKKSTCGYVGELNKVYTVSGADGHSIDIKEGLYEGRLNGVDKDRFELFTGTTLWFDEAIEIKIGDLLLAKTSDGIEKRCIVTYTELSGAGNELGFVAVDGTYGFFNALSNYRLNSDGIPMYAGRKILGIYRASDRGKLSSFLHTGNTSFLKNIWKPEVQVKEVTMAEVEAQFGCKVKVVK